MSAIGTEGLGLFEMLSRADGRPYEPLAGKALGRPTGQALRDAALSQHQQNHKADITRVRLALLAACRIGGLTEVTGDDASVIADQLGIPGDRRWLGSVFRGWERVRVTDRTIPSRLSRRHHRRVAVWQVL